MKIFATCSPLTFASVHRTSTKGKEVSRFFSNLQLEIRRIRSAYLCDEYFPSFASIAYAVDALGGKYEVGGA